MNTKTPEERSEERYPYSMQRMLWSKTDKGRHEYGVDLQRLAFEACIREQVEPLEAEVQKLRALVQELVNGCNEACEMELGQRGCISDVEINLSKCLNGLSTAKEAGFVPTNTDTQDK